MKSDRKRLSNRPTQKSYVLMTHADRRRRRKRLADAYAHGKTIVEVCQTFGVTARYAKQVCKEFGVSIRPQDGMMLNSMMLPSTYQIIAALCDGEQNMSRIADNFCVTRQRIHLIKEACVKAGIRVHSRYKRKNLHEFG